MARSYPEGLRRSEMLFVAIKESCVETCWSLVATHSKGVIMFVPTCRVKSTFSVQKLWNSFCKCPAALTCQPRTLYWLHLETSRTFKVAPGEACKVHNKRIQKGVYRFQSNYHNISCDQRSPWIINFTASNIFFSVVFSLLLAESFWMSCVNSQNKTDLQLTAADFPQ